MDECELKYDELVAAMAFLEKAKTTVRLKLQIKRPAKLFRSSWKWLLLLVIAHYEREIMEEATSGLREGSFGELKTRSI